MDSVHNSDDLRKGNPLTERAVSSRSECATVGNEYLLSGDRKRVRPVVIQVVFRARAQGARDEAALRKSCDIVPEEIDNVVVYLVRKV